MDAHAKLMSAYDDWRRWTEAEGDALRAANWSRVAQCQAAKRDMQPLILRLGEAARIEWARTADTRADLERAMRSVVGELIVLENRNGAILAQRRDALLTRKTEMDRSHCNLRRLRNSYAPARRPVWSSFS